MHSDGALEVERREYMFEHPSQWTHFDGTGGYRDDALYDLDYRAPKQQGSGRRWCYLPWTSKQEESCRPLSLIVKLKVRKKDDNVGVAWEQ